METIFGLPGMGRFLIDAIFQRDYPVVQGVILAAILTALAWTFVVLPRRRRTAPPPGDGAPPTGRPGRPTGARKAAGV